MELNRKRNNESKSKQLMHPNISSTLFFLEPKHTNGSQGYIKTKTHKRKPWLFQNQNTQRKIIFFLRNYKVYNIVVLIRPYIHKQDINIIRD